MTGRIQRDQLLYLVLVATLLGSACQSSTETETAAAPELNLRGDRFPGLTYDELTPAQKALADRALAGRGAVGSFNIMLRAPELSETIRGASGFRTMSELTPKLTELGIIMNSRYWTTQFEWLVHRNAAEQAGISVETIEAIRTGQRPTSMPPDEQAVYDFLRDLLVDKQVSDAHYANALEQMGEKGIVDLIGIVGFYHLTSLLMNVDRYPMADASQVPELDRLENPLPLE